MSPLRARVLGWLATNDEGDVETIARDVTARTADVRETLNVLIGEGLAVSVSRGTDPRALRRVYQTAVSTQDGLGRPNGNLSGALAALTGRPQPTQEDQILSLLADGTVWSSRELHRRVFCVLHSRISSLRKKLRPFGFDIEHSGGGAGTDEHFYQLVRVASSGAPLKEEPGVGQAARDLGRPGDTGPGSSLSGVTAVPPVAAQLTSPESESLTAAASGAVQGQTGESGEPRSIAPGGYVTRSDSAPDEQLQLEAA